MDCWKQGYSMETSVFLKNHCNQHSPLKVRGLQKMITNGSVGIRSTPHNMSDPWLHILECVKYNSEDITIRADDIKKAKETWTGGANQFEPRLLTYYSSSIDRPLSLRNKNLYILPIENGTYVLMRNNIYYSLKYEHDSAIPVQKDKSSLILNIGDSEMSALDNLRYSGVFERPEILGNAITHGPLLGGRHRTHTFSFQLGTSSFNVKGVQFEIDACYETSTQVLIIECKHGKKPLDSFNIRQLYYPYRVIMNKVGTSKKIICGFIHMLNNVAHIWLFEFSELERMDSIRQIGYYRFSLV